MSVSFYEESIQAEFGRDIATALTHSDSLSPVAKEMLLAKLSTLVASEKH